MSKHVIDDEMVERACHANHKMAEAADRNHAEQMRYVLDATLNPPPEPEIPVTEEMRKKGGDILCGRFGVSYVAAHEGVSHIYRAMRKLEPVTSWRWIDTPRGLAHWRRGERTPGGILHIHRRKTDK